MPHTVLIGAVHRPIQDPVAELHADMSQNQKAIARINPLNTEPGRYLPRDPLLTADRLLGELGEEALFDAYLAANNANPTPLGPRVLRRHQLGAFTWTKTGDQIVEKVQRGRVTLNAITS